MTLVGSSLCEKQGSLARLQQVTDFLGLGWVERPGGDDVEEASRQMEPALQRRFALQSTQRTDSGRASRRAAEIGCPQSAHVP